MCIWGISVNMSSVEFKSESLAKLKSLFFDREAVKNAVDKAILKNLNWIGGHIRRVARNSIKKAKSRNAESLPGKPPLSHVGLLKSGILYGFDKAKNSVVVGPFKLNAKGKDVPHNLEFGGTTTLIGKQFGGKKRVTISPRPYMRPALDSSQGKIADIWKNSIRKT